MSRYTLFALLYILWSCSSDVEQEVNCSTLQLQLKSVTNPTTCSPPNGSLRVFASGGSPPYFFRLNNNTFQSDSTFDKLQGGTYTVEVTDVKQCTITMGVTLANFNSNLISTFEVTSNTDCLIGNGTAMFTPSGGDPPYQLRFNNITIDNSMEVTGLKQGLYQVAIVDAQSCEFVMAVNVPRGQTGTSWSIDIKPIIETRCAKPLCHVAGTSRADLSKFQNVKDLASQIKTRTQNGSMPFDEPMPASQIQLIACWVDDGALNN